MQPPHGRDLKPTRAEAEEAVRTLIRWAGDDPGREGLRDTPGRVVRAYEEWFSIRTRIGNHTFRATGITAYLKNGARSRRRR